MVFRKKDEDWKFHLHFLQLGKALKDSSCLQSGDLIVVKAAAEKKLNKFNHANTIIRSL